MMQFDLIVVGGGLVGAGLTCALGEMPQRIALIDARVPTLDDPRLFALNYLSCQFLKNLNIWRALEHAAAPINQVHVSRKGQFGTVRLRGREVNLPQLGHVVPASLIELRLHEKLSHLSNVTIFQPASLQTIHQTADEVKLVIENEQGKITLTAPLVIGADGTRSTVREQLNIPTKTIDYEQSALVTQTILMRSHNNIAYERFTETGAIAMLPLQGDDANVHRCATIWSGPTAKMHELNALSDTAFLQTLQSEFGYRLGRLQKLRRRFLYPLQMVQAMEWFAGNVMLMGNAAHTLHPIAAQGFNLALFEVANFVEALKNLDVQGLSWTMKNLPNMQNLLMKQQKNSMRFAHQLPLLFSEESLLLSKFRPFFMTTLDVATPLKKQFINRLIGRAGRVPALLLSVNE